MSRYLNGTKHSKLYFQASNLEVVGYSDADFAGDRDDCKSTSGLFIGVTISYSEVRNKLVLPDILKMRSM